MTRCLIIDDEALALSEMRRLLSVHPDIKIVGEAKSVESALEAFRRTKPDAVFLDIQLRGETGFDFLGCLDEPHPRVVFVTAHDQHAIRAFECNALDYLLKPVNPERLAETLQRIRMQPRTPPPAGPDDCVLVKINSTMRFVPWRDILSIKSEGNYTRLFLAGGGTSLILRTLKAWERAAPAGQFIQAHRSMMVRREAIREIRPATGGGHLLVTSDGKEIPVGRAYWPELKKMTL